MQAIGFDNNKYLRMQSEKIRERISQFGGKLYLEFGGAASAAAISASPMTTTRCA